MWWKERASNNNLFSSKNLSIIALQVMGGYDFPGSNSVSKLFSILLFQFSFFLSLSTLISLSKLIPAYVRFSRMSFECGTLLIVHIYYFSPESSNQRWKTQKENEGYGFDASLFSHLISRFLFLVSCFSLLISRFSLNDTQFLPVSELSCVVLEQYCLSCHFRVLIFTLSRAGFQSGRPSSEIIQHSMRVCILIGSWMESEKVRSYRL